MPNTTSLPVNSASNLHYGYLNDRFDIRAGQLLKLGFKVERIEAYDLSVWVSRVTWGRKPMVIPSTLVMNADPVVWADTMVEAERWARIRDGK